MWLMVILAVIVVLTAISAASLAGSYEKLEAFFGSILIGAAFSLIIYAVALVSVDIFTHTKYESVGTVELLQLSDGSSVEGRFGLFSGFINSEQYYFYYCAVSRNSTVNNTFTVVVVVVEDSKAGGKLEIFHDVSGNDWVYTVKEDPKYILHVPKGTVIRSWKLDGPN